MEADFIALLLADPGVSGIVSDRVRPFAAPQDEVRPSITIQRVSGAPGYADDGEIGLNEARLQVDCWGNTYGAVKDLARFVQLATSAVRDVTQGTTFFVYIMLDNERDFRESGANAAEYLFRTSLDVIVLWSSP